MGLGTDFCPLQGKVEALIFHAGLGAKTWVCLLTAYSSCGKFCSLMQQGPMNFQDNPGYADMCI